MKRCLVQRSFASVVDGQVVSLQRGQTIDLPPGTAEALVVRGHLKLLPDSPLDSDSESGGSEEIAPDGGNPAGTVREDGSPIDPGDKPDGDEPDGDEPDGDEPDEGAEAGKPTKKPAKTKRGRRSRKPKTEDAD